MAVVAMTPHKAAAEAAKPVTVLEVEGVAKRFWARDRVVTALSETNLTVMDGEFITIVGPSGCGKSTVLNLVSGLTEPSDGSVKLLGKRISGVNRNVGYKDGRWWDVAYMEVSLQDAYPNAVQPPKRMDALSDAEKVALLLRDIAGRGTSRILAP